MINRKVLIIISKYYTDISENLLKSAVTFLEENSIIFDVIEVPGALEIPQVLNFQVNNSNNLRFAYEGYIALGCVIKGETYHFEIVANEASRALTDLSVNYSTPIGNHLKKNI